MAYYFCIPFAPINLHEPFRKYKCSPQTATKYPQTHPIPTFSVPSPLSKARSPVSLYPAFVKTRYR
ncbi:hypothetical protein ACTXT7_015182 [Hymenolepis weldensis]